MGCWRTLDSDRSDWRQCSRSVRSGTLNRELFVTCTMQPSFRGTPGKAPASPSSFGSPKRQLSSLAVRSPGMRSPLTNPTKSIAGPRPSAIAGLRFLGGSEPQPPSRTPAPPMRGPAGLGLRGPKAVENGHSFILEETRGRAPENLPEGSVHGVNPIIKWKVETLRDQRQTSSIELGTAVHLSTSAVIESHNELHKLIDSWEYTTEQAELLRTSVQNAKFEFRSAQESSNIHRHHIEDLRAESRELAIKEAELDLATSALAWVKQLPPDLPPCEACRPYLVPVALCRVVRGHRDDLPAGNTLDAVFFLHTNFTENASSRARFLHLHSFYLRPLALPNRPKIAKKGAPRAL